MVEQPQWRSAFRRSRLRGCGSAARFDGELSTRSRYYTTARKAKWSSPQEFLCMYMLKPEVIKEMRKEVGGGWNVG